MLDPQNPLRRYVKAKGGDRLLCYWLIGYLFLIALLYLGLPPVYAQDSGRLYGQVLDPSGAMVPGILLTLTQGNRMIDTHSGNDGVYNFQQVPEGTYALTVEAPGFEFPRANLSIVAGHACVLNLHLTVASSREEIQVQSQNASINVSPDENASAMIVKGSALDALSDDPDQLQNELQALAGSAAGPSGGQIYIDGFTGGELPPKSSIREIRINQNPFSAEFDRIGYGRIEILTKSGTDKFSGYVMSFLVLSALNTANPLVKQQPSYNGYSLPAYVSGPLTKHGSYFFSFFHHQDDDQSIIDAIDPVDTAKTVNETLPHSNSAWNVNPRIDFQLSKNNTLSIRDAFTRSTQTNNGVGALLLPQQAYSLYRMENAFQMSDTVIVNRKFINETHFQWRRIQNRQSPNYSIPTVTVQGAFTTGGNSSGLIQDHQDIFELQNYSTVTAGRHTVRFGAHLRSYRDANYSTSGANGTYIFQSTAHYLIATPDQYRATVVNNPLARALLFDAALFYQDDWRWKPSLTLSYGLRYEGQNRIRDHIDLAPRFALAWAPGWSNKIPPKTVLRFGYGWFYDRFTVPRSLNWAGGTPYVMQTIHQNGFNQRSYVINNPGFYNPTAPISPESLGSASAALPTVYTIDPHFHAALDMQGGIGVDRQLGKLGTINVTYLVTHGAHQYLSNNVTAPNFNPTTYTVTGPPPDAYNYQFQSGGIYRQQQVILTGNTKFRHISLNTSYTFNEARSDTQGTTYFPSVAGNPHLDYGRAIFDIHHHLMVLGTYTGPHKFIVSPMLIAQSGTPYNLTIGNDLTANNQFNARPTYGICGAAAVGSTAYGCLDTNPVGKGEKIVPYGLGTGSANVVFNVRVSKAFGIGPKVQSAHGATARQVGFSVTNPGLGGAQTHSKLDAEVPRRYTLTLIVSAYNLFNIVNRGTPNGVLNSSLFGTAQSLAGDPFQPLSSGNRNILLQASFNF
jgi:hypothetical protein